MGEQLEKPEQDIIRRFCFEFVRRHSENWPAEEGLLAREFVTHFRMPPFLHSANLEKIGESFGIKFVEEKLPDDLLGANFYFEGKRRIALADRLEHVGIKEHTFLHEIRELLEYDFRAIGFPTVKTDAHELESRADVFALSAILCCSEKTWESWTKSAFEIQSSWRMIAALILIFAGRVIYLFNAGYCARISDFEDSRRPLPPA
jgi:hypothetical protein